MEPVGDQHPPLAHAAALGHKLRTTSESEVVLLTGLEQQQIEVRKPLLNVCHAEVLRHQVRGVLGPAHFHNLDEPFQYFFL